MNQARSPQDGSLATLLPKNEGLSLKRTRFCRPPPCLLSTRSKIAHIPSDRQPSFPGSLTSLNRPLGLKFLQLPTASYSFLRQKKWADVGSTGRRNRKPHPSSLLVERFSIKLPECSVVQGLSAKNPDLFVLLSRRTERRLHPCCQSGFALRLERASGTRRCLLGSGTHQQSLPYQLLEEHLCLTLSRRLHRSQEFF